MEGWRSPVYRTCLENRRTCQSVPWVQIPPPPQHGLAHVTHRLDRHGACLLGWWNTLRSSRQTTRALTPGLRDRYPIEALHHPVRPQPLKGTPVCIRATDRPEHNETPKRYALPSRFLLLSNRRMQRRNMRNAPSVACLMNPPGSSGQSSTRPPVKSHGCTQPVLTGPNGIFPC